MRSPRPPGYRRETAVFQSPDFDRWKNWDLAGVPGVWEAECSSCKGPKPKPVAGDQERELLPPV